MNKISYVSGFNRIFMSRNANISSLLNCLDVLDFEDFVLTSFCHVNVDVLKTLVQCALPNSYTNMNLMS